MYQDRSKGVWVGGVGVVLAGEVETCHGIRIAAFHIMILDSKY